MKKILIAALFALVGLTMEVNATILSFGDGLTNGEVTTAKLGDGAVTTPKMNIEALDGFGGLLRLTNTGNHGIGTASPGEELEINSTSPVLRLRTALASEAGAIDWNVNGTNAWIIGTNYAVASSADTLEFRGNDNGTIMYLDDSAQSVGFNIAPTKEFHIQGSAGSNYQYALEQNNAGANYCYSTYIGSALTHTMNQCNNGGVSITASETVQAPAYGLYVNGVINTGGDIGIGLASTSTPGKELEISDATDPGIRLRDTTETDRYIDIGYEATGGGEPDLVIGISKGAGAVEKMRLDNNGVLSGSAIAGEYTAVVSSNANLGTYTPSANSWRWTRLGNQVNVVGRISFAATAASDTDTSAWVSLPVLSDFNSSVDLTGQCTGFGTTDRGIKIDGDSTVDQANLVWRADSTSSLEYSCSFMYEVK